MKVIQISQDILPIGEFKARFVAAVEAGLAESEAGQVMDDEALDAELDAVLGLGDRVAMPTP